MLPSLVERKKFSGSIIYEPKGRAREYMPLACNLYKGCSHGCVYCYAPAATFTKRDAFYSQPTPRINILEKLGKEAEKMRLTGDDTQVLFCFTSDPYHPEASITRKALEIIKANGINFCVLTKGGKRALPDIDLYGPGDSFASTLTCVDRTSSQEWEPNAALPDDRFETIKAFHEAGVHTWVSLEPVLDPQWAYEIIRRTHTFVDEYKVGVLNYHPKAKEIDWAAFGKEVVRLLESLDKNYYIKHDLKKYL